MVFQIPEVAFGPKQKHIMDLLDSGNALVNPIAGVSDPAQKKIVALEQVLPPVPETGNPSPFTEQMREDLLSSMGSATDQLGSLGSHISDNLSNFTSKFGKVNFAVSVQEARKAQFRAMNQEPPPDVVDPCNGVFEAFGTIMGSVNEAIGAIDQAVSDVFNAIAILGQEIADKIQELFDAIASGVQSVIDEITTQLQTAISAAIQGAGQLVQQMYETLADTVSTVVESISDAISDIASKIAEELNLDEAMNDLLQKFGMANGLPSIFDDPCGRAILERVASSDLLSTLTS